MTVGAVEPIGAPPPPGAADAGLANRTVAAMGTRPTRRAARRTLELRKETLSLSGAYGVSCRARAERAALRHKSGDSPLEPDRLLWGPPLPRHVVSGLGWVLIAGEDIRTRCRRRSRCGSCNGRESSRALGGVRSSHPIPARGRSAELEKRSRSATCRASRRIADRRDRDAGPICLICCHAPNPRTVVSRIGEPNFLGRVLRWSARGARVTSASPSANPVGKRIAAIPRPRRLVHAFTICSFLVRTVCNHAARL